MPPSPTDQVDVIARVIGSLEYVCPACGKFNCLSRVHWRSAKTVCTKNKDWDGKCERVYRLGVLFRKTPLGLPPFNALYVTEVGRRTTFNRVGEVLEPWQPAIGRITGVVEWWCPACGRHERGCPEWKQGRVECGQGHVWFVSLLVVAPPRGMQTRTPADWVPPLGEGDEVATLGLGPLEDREGVGADRGRVGADGGADGLGGRE